MSIKSYLTDRIFGATIDRKVTERITAAGYSSGSYPGASPDTDKDGTIWRRLTTDAARDLLPTDQDRMIEIAYWLKDTNPLAGWLIDVTTSFIVAEGLPYATRNDDVKACLDAFWNDPVNRLSLNFPRHVDELHIFGELCFPAFTAAQTGRVRLGYVDPAMIQDVITDPENVKMTIGVLTKAWSAQVGNFPIEMAAKKYRTILPEEADFVLSPTARALREQFTDGECFFWAINNVTNSPRGRSSLFSIADWLDAYEQFLFDYAEKWPLQNSFIFDLLVQGADDNEIKKQVAAFTKKSGSVYGHNEKITLDAVTPDLKSLDAAEGARIFRNHILGRFGYPEHWYGGGGDVNRATAAEMDAPALKMLSRKQLAVKYILEDMLTYQIRQARAARYLRVSDEDATVSVTTPEMASKDVGKLSSSAQAVATALVTAEMQQWVDKETARRIWASVVSFTGVDIDLDEVRAAIEEQGNTEGYEDYAKKADGTKPDLRAVEK
jgi:hypothetical protein